MRKIYYGGWSANNNSTYGSGYKETNKRRLAKDMRDICKGNVFIGNTGSWSVIDEQGQVILSGIVRG